MAGRLVKRVTLYPYVGNYSEAVFSVVAAFLADDGGRFVAEVEVVELRPRASEVVASADSVHRILPPGAAEYGYPSGTLATEWI